MGLVLTRFADESFWVGDDVEVKVIGVTCGKVRLLITAPKHVAIDRDEVRRWKTGQSGRPERGNDS